MHALGFAVHFSPEPVDVVGVVAGVLLFGTGAAIGRNFPGTEMIALGRNGKDQPN